MKGETKCGNDLLNAITKLNSFQLISRLLRIKNKLKQLQAKQVGGKYMQTSHVMYAAIDRVESIMERFAATVVLVSSNEAFDEGPCILASVSWSFVEFVALNEQTFLSPLVKVEPEAASLIKRDETGVLIVAYRNVSPSR